MPKYYLQTTRGRGVQPRSYTTSFTLTENPIAESGNWVSGASLGVDWLNMQTTPGLAFGGANFTSNTYNDATAVLTGTWRPNHAVQGTVKSLSQQNGTTNFQEVELRLRTSISPHRIAGYEVNWSCLHNGNQYHQVGYWYGPIGVNPTCTLGCAFDAVPNSINSAGNGMDSTHGNGIVGNLAQNGFPGLYDGDTVGAQIVGNRITTWILYGPNSPNPGVYTQLQDFFDTGGTSGGAFFTQGSPGIGHWYHSTLGSVSDFGLTSFRAVELF